MADGVGDVGRGSRVVVLIAGTAVLLVIGAMVAIPMGYVVELSAVTCTSPRERLVCDPSTRRLVALLPMLALAAGLVLVAAGGAVAVRRGRPTAPWQCAAWIMLAGAALFAWSVATA